MRPLSVAICFGILLVPVHVASAQFDGIEPVTVETSVAATPTATIAAQLLDDEIEFGALDISVGDLVRFLQDELGEVAVFLDSRGLKMAGVTEQTNIKMDIHPMPLRAAMRKMLEPLGLKVTVEDEGLVITADFVTLTRRGIATEMSLRPELDEKLLEKLDQSVSISIDEVPLIDFVDQLSQQINIPMSVDRRALEEIGLSSEEAVSFDLKDLTLRSALRLSLRELDLTYLVKDEVLQITTVEAAEQNLVTRLYFLEGIGITGKDADSIIRLVQATVVPDTWESLGGPSTMQPYFPSGRSRSRPCLVISTTSDVHQQISPLLDGLRRANLGPDPRPAAADKEGS